MIGKNIIFLFVFVGFLSAFSFTYATDPGSPVITLPNPLESSGVGSFADLIENITKYIAGVIGMVAILMFVISGIQFVTSAGNPGKIDQAKKTAIYAAIGTGIALAGAGLIELVKTIISYTP